MRVIPVIDLKGGTVVRARLGRRDEYRPIETPLATTSDPVDVAHGLMSVYPFASLYVADLDAIEKTADNRRHLARLKAAFPALTLWVDNGISTPGAADAWLASRLGHLVLGSETQRDDILLRRLASDERIVLSLDFRGDAFQGPAAILADQGAWPQRILCMTLGRVGSASGPDLARLAELRKTAPDRDIYAAGGVRDLADLRRLAQAGITGALVATSLHDGRLTGPDLATL
ncbi:MAG: nickel transporter [Methylobacteriaceae bacterium]|nr:nickel transporter [Methylobacteriaceae bacterium]MBV9634982.1 nickel transporter [Methylobacteriaceae bacterium]MBV9703161.1 nickel transporter [Methylobacteriaceae bacterium]